MLCAVSFAASSILASSKMIAGDLPPSSRIKFLRLELAAATLISFPVRIEPVNVKARTSICDASAFPELGPWPERTLRTPGGKPASFARRATYRDFGRLSMQSRYERLQEKLTVKGAFSLLLTTTVLPAANAGATFLQKKIRGQFQGMIAATTPTGCITVIIEYF